MEPRYQMTGPGLDEVIEMVKNQKNMKSVNHREKYNKLIEEVIEEEYIKYSGFGSYIGFYTFTLPAIMNIIRKRILDNIKNKILVRRLTQSIVLKNWVNHLLYRMPDKNSGEKIGLRVGKHQISFEQHQKKHNNNNNNNNNKNIVINK